MNTKKINIAFICFRLPIGGHEMAFINMVKYINRQKFNPIACSLQGGLFLDDIKNLDIKIITGSDKDPLARDWTQADARKEKIYLDNISNEMKRANTTVALIFGWEGALKAVQEAGVPVIMEKLNGPLTLDEVEDKSSFDKIICESEWIKDLILSQKELFKCSENQFEVIPNGIDLEKFGPKKYDSRKEKEKLGIHPDEFVIGYVGRLSAEKNLRFLLRSVKLLSLNYKFNNFKLVIVGPDYGDLNNLKKNVSDLELDNNVIFTGMRNDIPNILATFNIFAMSSLHEGSPTAMIEAMAMGLPVISTAVGLIPEIIKGNGFSVPLLGPRIFARKLHVLARDTELREKMKKESMKLSQKYDIKKTMRKYEELFVACLNKKRIW